VQREVITLRDVVGMEAEEVCRTMGLSDGNQRVLLHRARSRVRRALDLHFTSGEDS
jgi:RNA polymerase sigma-70 factor (ECF subfamily)